MKPVWECLQDTLILWLSNDTKENKKTCNADSRTCNVDFFVAFVWLGGRAFVWAWGASCRPCCRGRWLVRGETRVGGALAGQRRNSGGRGVAQLGDGGHAS